METDKHYFFEGLFIISLALALAFFAVWLAGAEGRNDVLYRIHFTESVSGLAVGDTVKYHGVDVGTVKSMMLNPDDPRQVRVDVLLRQDAPVRTDTRASLKLKGITGAVFIELSGGNPKAKSLLAVTPANKIPEIPSEKSDLGSLLEQLPKVVEKFSSIENQAKKTLSDLGELINKIKEDPSVLFWRPKK